MNRYRVTGIVAVVCLLCASSDVLAEQDGKTGAQLSPPGKITFRTNSAELAKGSEKALAYVADYLARHEKVRTLRIEVHSDARGSSAYNLALTKKRALAVAGYLVGKGVGCERLLPVGFGEETPLVKPERTEADRARNRRVVFFLAQIEGEEPNLTPDGGGHVAGDPCHRKS